MTSLKDSSLRLHWPSLSTSAKPTVSFIFLKLAVLIFKSIPDIPSSDLGLEIKIFLEQQLPPDWPPPVNHTCYITFSRYVCVYAYIYSNVQLSLVQ